MYFAKYINENQIIRCPRNGYVGKKAISNLEKYFSKKPDAAKEQGYMEFIPAEIESTGEICYRLENGKIYEEVKAIDSKITY